MFYPNKRTRYLIPLKTTKSSDQNIAVPSNVTQAKECTNQMYKSFFGEPPADVWEYATMHGALQLPKSTYKLRSGIQVGLFILAVWLIPAYFLLQPFYLAINGNDFLPGYIALWVVSLLALAV